MRDSSWILEVIEKEALARASAIITRTGPVTAYGLNMSQVRMLISYWEKTTGLPARQVTEETLQLNLGKFAEKGGA